MQPPARSSLGWIDQRWDAIGATFPDLTMDWLYHEHSADRLKHHRWMLTRPSFLKTTHELHRLLAVEGDALFRVVTKGTKFKFPAGVQRDLALAFLHRLQMPNGAEVAMFVAATACELLGTTPFCAFQEAALREWRTTAFAEEVPPPYGNVYNLLFNIVAQSMIWVLGCYPYAVLQQLTTPNTISSEIDLDRKDANLRLLQRYTLALNGQLQRISRHPPTGRTYHESETH